MGVGKGASHFADAAATKVSAVCTKALLCKEMGFPHPPAGTGRQCYSPKLRQLDLQVALTGTECGCSVCNIHQKPKALQIFLAGRVPFSRR